MRKTVSSLKKCRMWAWGCAILAGFSFMSVSDPLWASDIVWNEGRATAVGTGCRKDVDTYILANGSDLSLIFTNLGFNLTGSSEPLSGAKTCTFRVPARISTGFYVADLTQAMIYGITKTENSDATLRNSASFFGVRTTSPAITARRGQRLDEPFLEERRRDRFSRRNSGRWVSSWCEGRRSDRGAFRGRISVRARRDNTTEDLIVFVDGLDVRYEVQSLLSPCD